MDVSLSICMEKLHQCRHRRMLLSLRSLKLLNSIEKIYPRMMIATFNDNPCTTIIFCNSSINTSDETDLITFYNELSSLVHTISKYSVLIIGWDINVRIGKDENSKFCLHNSSNGNGEQQTDFSLENRITCINTNFQKMEGKLRPYTYSNNAQAHIEQDT